MQDKPTDTLPNQGPGPWHMTATRRTKMTAALQALQILIDRTEPELTFKEVENAIGKLTFEHETIRNA